MIAIHTILCAVLLGLSASKVGALPLFHHGQSILKDSGKEGITQSLLDASVIPDVLPESFEPSFALDITWPSSHSRVALGNTIPVKATSSRPTFQATPLDSLSLTPTRTLAENRTSFTLVLSDPDATSRAEPVKAQMCHWIATGIKLQRVNETEGAAEGDSITYALDMRPMHYAALGRTDADSVTELMEYMAPAPPPKTGKHRYVFVLLEPEDANDGPTGDPEAPKERPHWGYGQEGKGVMDWARDNSLRPVAANFFCAQNKKQ